MKHHFFAALLATLIGAIGSETTAQDLGESLFNQTCVACHTIGSGRLVGPDLAGVHTRRDEDWLIAMIQSPQSMIADEDPIATALLAEYNGVLMPDQALSDSDVRAVLGYIALRSGGVPVVSEPVAEVDPADLLPESVQIGKDLFVGRTRFENGGAPCISCHNVTTADIMTGGSLAVDLTDSISRLSRPGVDAMMANPPFAPMRVAFDGKAITAEERAAIVDYLQHNESIVEASAAVDWGTRLLTYGIVGIAALLGFFFFLGMRGEKETVNRSVYERQIQSR